MEDGDRGDPREAGGKGREAESDLGCTEKREGSAEPEVAFASKSSLTM